MQKWLHTSVLSFICLFESEVASCSDGPKCVENKLNSIKVVFIFGFYISKRIYI